MMRITILNQYFAPDISPTAKLATSLAEHRAIRGDQVTVITGTGGYALNDSRLGETRFPNLRICRVWIPGLGRSAVWRRLVDYAFFFVFTGLRILCLARQDIVIVLTTPPFIALAAVLHKWLHPTSRLILWNMDCYPEVAEQAGQIKPGAPASRLMRRLNQLLFRSLDHLVCLDEPMREHLISDYGAPGDSFRVTIVPNWEAEAEFECHRTARPSDEQETQDNPGRFTVLYSGNLGVGHSFETILDAAEMLRSEPVQFVFNGGGSRWKAFDARRRRQGLVNIVLQQYRSHDEYIQLLANADCGLITLRDEMLGLMSPSKVHASLAMGLPVIYVGPPRSNVDVAIEAFDCGASLRNGDAQGLTDFIRQLRADPGLWTNYSKRARVGFERAYCDRRTLSQFDAVVESSKQRSLQGTGRSQGQSDHASAPSVNSTN